MPDVSQKGQNDQASLHFPCRSVNKTVCVQKAMGSAPVRTQIITWSLMVVINS